LIVHHFYSHELKTDESFVIKHDRTGIVAMANDGPHSNTSQFYITLGELEYLDCRKTAFGKVVMGAAALSKLNQLPTKNERPTPSLVISSCGIYAR
jgi:cyclophilin family peptidyl-prolyl cis-trans isomerase